MASTALVREVMWRVSVLLQDTSPQFQLWPERELVQWLNDAQMAICKYLPLACSRVDTMKLKQGTRQSIELIAAADLKPGDGSTPAGNLYGTQFLGPRRNMGADGLTPGRAVRMVERDVMDSQDPDWHTRSGPAVWSVVYDPLTPRYFYVSPGVPASPAVWMELAMAAKPLVIPNTGSPPTNLYAFEGSSTQTITIDDEFVEDLANYVVARANMSDKKWSDKSAAEGHTKLFLSSLNGKVSAITGNNPNLTVLPGVTQPGASS